MLGVQALPVRSDGAAAGVDPSLFFSLVTSFTASATDEVGTSGSCRRRRCRTHLRAMLEPRVGFVSGGRR